MSLFEEKAWETDETADKLVGELFRKSKKKNKSVKKPTGTCQSHDNVARNGKKKSQIVQTQSDDVKDSQDPRGGKGNSKKRKASQGTIDETFIKRWKMESLKQSGASQIDRDSVRDSAAKAPKLASRSGGVAENKTPLAKVAPKKKKVESEEKTIKSITKKLPVAVETKIPKKVLPQIDPSVDQNIVTKSKKRKVKHKLKLLSQSTTSEVATLQSNGENDTEHRLSAAVNGVDNSLNESQSSDRVESNKTNKAGLRIDRLKRLLADKQQGASKKSNGLKTDPTSLRDRMLARLKSSRFRFLNEQMYNSESWSSKKYFKDDPDAFAAYHEGYQLQVEQWPLNPLDNIIASIKKMSKEFVIADFGCGEARLAESVPQKVHSLDLVAINDRVTACDMAHTSLLTGRIDVVVFCLSLMGANLADYLKEANRVLRNDGILKIAEVESRFEDVDEFIKVLATYGFTNTWKDLSHNLFYFMDFKKTGELPKKRNKLLPVTLKSCLYKKR